jgi:predicted O-methyltransferase YrrM
MDEHGVHSPFVFELLTSVIYNNKDYYAYRKAEELRNRLFSDQSQVSCQDPGAGPARGRTSKKVKDIARRSAKTAKYGALLFRLVDRFQPRAVLELGTSLGISTTYLALANSKIPVTTVEGCAEISRVASTNFSELEIGNVSLIQGHFDEVLPSLLQSNNSFDLVFFDGNHTKEATLRYFNLCLEKATDRSVFVVDDIYWSPGMMQAWEEIKADKKVTVTIDLFYMGIVFFHKEQVKQDFVIRF